jgi:hypothetical protein
LLPSCDHLWATDHRWWDHHIGDITKDYEGQCWTQDVQWPASDSPQAWGIECLIADTTAGGLSRDKEKVHTGSNSGYAAIGLAYHLGATRILLLGYDMMVNGNQKHWFGDHPGKLNVGSNYQSFINRFRTIKPEDYGIEIWNVSRRTALNCFPIYDLDEVYESLI